MRSLIAILSLLGAVTLNAQPAVNLYLEPEANGVVFKTVPLSEAQALSPEHPVSNGKVDNDWYRIAYPGHYVGFVEVAQTNKDGTFKPGAQLFIRKSTASGIIARIQVGDNAKAIDRSGNWATVAFQGDGHVYYRNPDIFPPLPSVASAQATQQRVTITAPRTAATPAAASTAPGVAVSTIPVAQEGGEIIAVEELEVVTSPPAQPAPQAPTARATTAAPKPAPQAPRPAPAPVQAGPQQPVLPPPGYAPVNTATAAQNKVLSREVPRLYEGTFSRIRGFSFDFFAPDYSYALQDASGKRIAYVEIDNALLVSPIEAYLDKPVIIEGVAEKTGTTVPIVIKAKFIRLTR
jgi:hypothetical protein